MCDNFQNHKEEILRDTDFDNIFSEGYLTEADFRTDAEDFSMIVLERLRNKFVTQDRNQKISIFFDHLPSEISKRKGTTKFQDALEKTLDAFITLHTSIERSILKDLTIKDEQMEDHFNKKGKQILRTLTNKDLDLLWDFQNYRLSYLDSDVDLEKLYRDILTEYSQLFSFIEEEVQSNTKNLVKYLKEIISEFIEKYFAEDLFRGFFDSELNQKIQFVNKDGSFDSGVLEKLEICFSKCKLSSDFDAKYEVVISDGVNRDKLVI